MMNLAINVLIVSHDYKGDRNRPKWASLPTGFHLLTEVARLARLPDLGPFLEPDFVEKHIATWVPFNSLDPLGCNEEIIDPVWDSD